MRGVTAEPCAVGTEPLRCTERQSWWPEDHGAWPPELGGGEIWRRTLRHGSIKSDRVPLYWAGTAAERSASDMRMLMLRDRPPVTQSGVLMFGVFKGSGKPAVNAVPLRKAL